MQQQRFQFWEWVRDKVMPSLIVALCIGVFATYVQTIRLVDAHENTRAEVIALKAEVANMRENYVRRLELIEIQKRIEQQLEIIILKSRNSK